MPTRAPSAAASTRPRLAGASQQPAAAYRLRCCCTCNQEPSCKQRLRGPRPAVLWPAVNECSCPLGEPLRSSCPSLAPIVPTSPERTKRRGLTAQRSLNALGGMPPSRLQSLFLVASGPRPRAPRAVRGSRRDIEPSMPPIGLAHPSSLCNPAAGVGVSAS